MPRINASARGPRITNEVSQADSPAVSHRNHRRAWRRRAAGNDGVTQELAMAAGMAVVRRLVTDLAWHRCGTP